MSNGMPYDSGSVEANLPRDKQSQRDNTANPMNLNTDHKPLVLIVDDSPTHVAQVRQTLEGANYRVAVAATGRQGLEQARELGPDLIVMDVVMPDLNGFQTTRKLSKNPITQHIPIVLASSKSGDSDKIWGLRQGAVAYLTKPFEESEFLTVIHDALKRAAAVASQLANARD